MANGQGDQMIDRLGREGRGRPRDSCAPIVTDQRGPVRSKARQAWRSHRLREIREAVGVDFARLVACPIPASVGHDDLKSRFDQRRDLPDPEPLRVRKTMQQHDWPARPFNLNIELHTVGIDLHRTILSTQVFEAPRATSSSRLGPGSCSFRHPLPSSTTLSNTPG
jgi:hypothetical protein